MPLPYRPGAKRMAAQWRTFRLDDPAFDGPVAIALRPLLDVELDKVDEAADEFERRHIVGGWVDKRTGAFQKDRQPIVIDGAEVPIAAQTALRMHRYEAMQRPLPGGSPPPAEWVEPTPESAPEGWEPERVKVVFLPVADLVDATVRADAFWRAFQVHAGGIWQDGQSGKAWAAPDSTEPPRP